MTTFNSIDSEEEDNHHHHHNTETNSNSSSFNNHENKGVPNLLCQANNARKVSNMLKAIHIKDQATVIISNKGMRVVVEDAGILQANAFLQSALFENYQVSDTCEFGISLNTLLQCLNIFGLSSNINTVPSLRLEYACYGSPLNLVLIDHGICTECSIKTIEPEINVDLDFRASRIPNKNIIKSEIMKAAIGELDSSSDVLEILMSPDEPYFRFSTYGCSGNTHIDFPKDSEAIETTFSSYKQCHRYKLALMKKALKTLAYSRKVSFRMNARGFLSLHFMMENDGLVSFVEYLCVPEQDLNETNDRLDNDDEEEGSESDDDDMSNSYSYGDQ